MKTTAAKNAIIVTLIIIVSLSFIGGISFIPHYLFGTVVGRVFLVIYTITSICIVYYCESSCKQICIFTRSSNKNTNRASYEALNYKVESMLSNISYNSEYMEAVLQDGEIIIRKRTIAR